MIRKPRPKQIARNFPPSFPKISTAEYIRRYYQINFLGTPPYAEPISKESK